MAPLINRILPCMLVHLLLHCIAIEGVWDKFERRDDEVARVKINVDTDFGDWGRWEYCPKHKWVSAYELKVANSGTAMNGIQMYCSCRRHGMYSHMTKHIRSTDGPEGSYGTRGYCATHFTGMNLTWQTYQVGGNDHAAVDATMLCPNEGGKERNDERVVVKDLKNTVKTCPTNSAICGLRTQVEGLGFFGWADTVGLNTLMFACCRLS